MEEHDNEHNLLLLRRVPDTFLFFLSFNLRDDYSIYTRATEKMRQTQSMFDRRGDKQEENLQCISCLKTVTCLPCWACVPIPGKPAFFRQKLILTFYNDRIPDRSNGRQFREEAHVYGLFRKERR